MTVQDTTRPAYDAARTGAVWIDRSAEGRLEVRGEDRTSWLQGLLTNDVAALVPGQGCYAAHLTPQGRMIADVRVLVHGDLHWLDVPAPVKDAVLARLDMFVISEDVTLRDLSGERSRVAVYGPSAARAVAAALVDDGEHREACGQALAALPPHGHPARPWRGHDLVVAATRDLGIAGFDLYPRAEQREAVADALAAAGAVSLDEATWDLLRLEAGRPVFGRDLDEDTIPLEADLEGEAISFTKGCYVGQEIIVRMRDRGQGRVAKRLMRIEAALASEGPGVGFGPGDALSAGGRDVGRVTSAAWSPRSGRTIGLGYVLRAHATAGATLVVRHADGEAEVILQPRDAAVGPSARPAAEDGAPR